MKETRRDIRLPSSFRVTWETVDQLAIDYAKDLSKGGMFLVTEREFVPGTVVKLELCLPETNTCFPVMAQVVHCRDEAAAQASGLPRGLGVEFVSLTPEIKAQIEAFVRERMETYLSSGGRGRGLRVLIVDDEASYRNLASQAFREGVDEVIFAADGFEALSRAFGGPLDVVISDVHMPRMDGWQLLRLLRSRAETRHLPFIFLTRLGSEEERLRGYQLGVDDYLAKPFRAVELRARIERLVARKPDPSPVTQALRGDLSLVSLASLLSFLELERRTGQLRISGPQPGRMLIEAGRPLLVELDGCDAPPDERALRFLDLKEGEFEFVARPVEGADEIGMGMTQLLLEHARLRDEAP